jgi:hypothetical protein
MNKRRRYLAKRRRLFNKLANDIYSGMGPYAYQIALLKEKMR